MRSDPSTVADESALWARWAANHDQITRRLLVERYQWLVTTSASRALRERNFDADLDRRELEQLGQVGLLEALERFDPQKGKDFSMFAVKRVYGAIIDGISQSSDLRAQISAANDIRQERLRSIRDQEGSDRLARLVDIAVGLAIGIMLEDTAMFVDPTAEPIREYSSNELSVLRDQFRRTVEELPGKQRDVIRHHYYHDLAFSEIAELLGISKPRVSQLHAAALKAVRERIQQLDLIHGLY